MTERYFDLRILSLKAPLLLPSRNPPIQAFAEGRRWAQGSLNDIFQARIATDRKACGNLERYSIGQGRLRLSVSARMQWMVDAGDPTGARTRFVVPKAPACSKAAARS